MIDVKAKHRIVVFETQEICSVTKEISLNFLGAGLSGRRDVHIKSAIVAGWTGRDPALVEIHIRELEEMGVSRPPSVPVFYRVAAARVTTASSIEVLGEASSGEVEFVILQALGRLWVGVGSDHTDREVERYNVSTSKQMCEKPIANTFWDFDEIAPHWDSLLLQSYIFDVGDRRLYQEGLVTGMRTASDLVDRYAHGGGLEDGTIMFCGTLATRGGIRPSPRFEFLIEDPILSRRITHAYDMRVLPIFG